VAALRDEARELSSVIAAAGPPASGLPVIATGYLLPGTDLKTAFLTAAGLVTDPCPLDVFSGPLIELRAR
jgi:hypothetical protein